jgi:hypothetical protein
VRVELAHLERLQEALEEVRQRMQRAERDRDAALKEQAELDEKLTQAYERVTDANNCAIDWIEAADAAQKALEEERQERQALVEHEVREELGRKEPKRRGRPPSWRPEKEDRVVEMHEGGASIRQIAADLSVSPTQVHRVLVRQRRQKAEIKEIERIRAISEGRSPQQHEASGTLKAAERRGRPG